MSTTDHGSRSSLLARAPMMVQPIIRNVRFPPIADIIGHSRIPSVENGRPDALKRWIWVALCLALAVLAFLQGGLLLVGLVALAIVTYGVLFAVIATLIGGQPLASNFRRALVDGPLFILGFW